MQKNGDYLLNKLGMTVPEPMNLKSIAGFLLICCQFVGCGNEPSPTSSDAPPAETSATAVADIGNAEPAAQRSDAPDLDTGNNLDAPSAAPGTMTLPDVPIPTGDDGDEKAPSPQPGDGGLEMPDLEPPTSK